MISQKCLLSYQSSIYFISKTNDVYVYQVVWMIGLSTIDKLFIKLSWQTSKIIYKKVIYFICYLLLVSNTSYVIWTNKVS